MNCKNCDLPLRTDYSFCSNCGAKVIRNRLTLKNLWYDFTERFSILSKLAFIHGQDISNNIPLIYMPSNNIYGAIQYELKSFEKNNFKALLKKLESDLNSLKTKRSDYDSLKGSL